MHRMNFEQKPAGDRDVGGPPGLALLLAATALVLWMLGSLLRSTL